MEQNGKKNPVYCIELMVKQAIKDQNNDLVLVLTEVLFHGTPNLHEKIAEIYRTKEYRGLATCIGQIIN